MPDRIATPSAENRNSANPQRPHDVESRVRAGLAAYRKVLLIRTSEEAIVKYYPEDDMKTPMHMTMGQEAIPAGVCLGLGASAEVFATYRSHGVFLARTEDPNAFFAELYGRVTGPGRGKGGSMHLSLPHKGHLCSSAVVGSCLPLAVGAAFAFRSRGEDKTSCVFFGDGALDEGSFWESLNAACVLRLSVLFVCEDNDWAVHTSREHRAGYDSIVEVVGKMRCLVAEADTNDVEDIAGLTADIAQRSRESNCPAFLKLKCCRYLEHVGINCDLSVGYRTQESIERWRSRDAVMIQRQKLLERGIPETELAMLESDIKRDVQLAIDAAKRAASPDPHELWEGVLL